MINFLKNKYYWYRNFNRLSVFFKRINNRKILIYGYPKSGNTWLRFLVYNYHSLLLDFSRNNTLTYKELNSLQNNVMDRGDTNLPINDFPFIYRTHAIHIDIELRGMSLNCMPFSPFPLLVSSS